MGLYLQNAKRLGDCNRIELGKHNGFW